MTRRNRIMIIWIGAITLLMIGAILQVRASPAINAVTSPIDVAEGDRLAHTLCVNCHVVDSRSPVIRTDQVPSFSWVAQQPGLTQQYITNWLSTSHERMPDFTLSREEIRQLSAYIMSLKKP